MGWTAGVRFATGARDFSVIHSIQTSSGAHPASYPMGTGGSFPEGKEGHETDHPPVSSAEVMNGVLLPLQHTSSWSGP
jgi:hypothetical protein